jgi:hypothetical protein
VPWKGRNVTLAGANLIVLASRLNYRSLTRGLKRGKNVLHALAERGLPPWGGAEDPAQANKGLGWAGFSYLRLLVCIV